jgi:hypothetical protein
MTTAVAPGSQVTREQAEAITQNIRNAIERAYGGIEHAWKVRADIAMGYGSWAEYVKAEFDTDHLAVPRAERASFVAMLHDAGMSTRAIAASVNVDPKTVRNDLEAGGENSSPEDASSKPVTGTDGKTYTRKPKATNPDGSINPTGVKKSWKNRTKFASIMAELATTEDLTRDEIFATIKIMEDTITTLKGNLSPDTP